MATRYSGNVVVRLAYSDRDGKYVGAVKWPGRRTNMIVGHPAHLTMSVDSPEAYDQAAHAAIAFVDNELGYMRRDNFSPDYTDSGYAIRRTPPSAGLRGFGGPTLWVNPLLVTLKGGEVIASELGATIGVPDSPSREILTRIERGQRGGDSADRILKMVEGGILWPYDASRIPTFGVQAIIDPRRSYTSAHGQVVAYYLNTGDPYTWHLMYDVDKKQFLLAAWGDWLEQYENENGPIEG